MKKIVLLTTVLVMALGAGQLVAQDILHKHFHKGMKPLIEAQKNKKSEVPHDVKTATRTLRQAVHSPEIIIIQSFNESTKSWENAQRSTFTYVSDQYVAEELIEAWYGDDFYLESKHISAYDDAWRLVSETAYLWDAFEEVWVPYMKETMDYDAYGNTILEASYYWNSFASEWEMSSGTKWAFEYSATSKPLQLTISYWDGSSWFAYAQEILEYDTFDRLQLIYFLYLDEDSGEFVPEMQEEYTYNAADEWVEVLIYEYWGAWYPVEWVTDISWYDFQSLKISNATMWEPAFKSTSFKRDDWMPYSRLTAEYHPEFHENTYMLEELYDAWEEEWVPSMRLIYDYEQNGFPTLFTYEFYDEDGWFIFLGMQWEYVYDLENRPEMVTVQFYDGFETGSWVNMMRVLHFYDVNVSTPELKDFAREVMAYPNPTRGIVTLAIPNTSVNALVTFYSLTGQVMHQEAIMPQMSGGKITLNISHLENGLYLLEFRSGSERNVIRLVKNR